MGRPIETKFEQERFGEKPEEGRFALGVSRTLLVESVGYLLVQMRNMGQEMTVTDLFRGVRKRVDREVLLPGVDEISTQRDLIISAAFEDTERLVQKAVRSDELREEIDLRETELRELDQKVI